MPSIRFLMLGGFLGAGKTTTIARLASHYQSRGQRVGIVTNDQATDLVDTNSLRAKGFGESKPIATNATALGRAKNRRVDFRLIKAEIETPARTVPADKKGEDGAGKR